MDNPVVILTDISKAFGNSPVLHRISLTLEKGKFYTLLGRNGAGKSTLMRILMRYEQPDEGEGWILHRSIAADFPNINYDVGYVSETLDYSLPLKIGKFFSFYSSIYPNWDQTIFNNLLKILRLETELTFRELSRGQKMQVAFAAAIAIQPRLILLDEVTSVLDPDTRSYFMQHLSEFTRKGGTVLMATNIVSDVHHFAHHLIVIDSGEIKLNIQTSEASKIFRKLRKFPNDANPVFQDETCVQVGINSDSTSSYLVSSESSKKYSISNETYDNRGITPEEIFIYYTRGHRD